MNLKRAICDDEIEDIKTLQNYITQFNIQSDNNLIVENFCAASDLLAHNKETRYDVVLLDIEMPDMNGMELARHLRQVDDDLFIIFTTSYPEYMQDSFEVQPFQFLSKPITYDTIHNLFTNIIQKINRNLHTIILVDDDNEKHFVYLNDILSISTVKGQKSRLRYQLSDRDYIAKGTFSQIEPNLLSHGFISPTRGILVNTNQIQSLNSTRILLKNGTELPISRRRMKDIQKVFTNHIIKIMN